MRFQRSLLACLATTAIITSFLLPSVAVAASSPWSQTDWSSGQYSSITDVYTGALNQVTLLSNFSHGTGADGAITVSSSTDFNTTNIISGRSCSDGGDAVNYSVTTSVSSGTDEITLSSTPSSGCLATGDEILIINLRGTSGDNSNVGKYETAIIDSINTATLTLKDALTNSYDGTSQKIMVQRVPNYTDVTLNASMYASAWNGTKGGVVFFRATGSVTTGTLGSINMNYKGYVGGASVGQNTNGRQGEGIAGPADSAEGTGGICSEKYNAKLVNTGETDVSLVSSVT